MKHRGEVLEKAIRKSGIKLTILAKRLNKSRGYIYTLFDRDDIPAEVMIHIGKIIGHDFAVELKELTHIYKNVHENGIPIKEPEVNYPETETLDYWKSKYITLLEKYNSIIENNSQTKKKVKGKKSEN